MRHHEHQLPIYTVWVLNRFHDYTSAGVRERRLLLYILSQDNVFWRYDKKCYNFLTNTVLDQPRPVLAMTYDALRYYVVGWCQIRLCA
jgi:hypothetical protein